MGQFWALKLIGATLDHSFVAMNMQVNGGFWVRIRRWMSGSYCKPILWSIHRNRNRPTTQFQHDQLLARPWPSPFFVRRCLHMCWSMLCDWTKARCMHGMHGFWKFAPSFSRLRVGPVHNLGPTFYLQTLDSWCWFWCSLVTWWCPTAFCEAAYWIEVWLAVFLGGGHCQNGAGERHPRMVIFSKKSGVCWRLVVLATWGVHR